MATELPSVDSVFKICERPLFRRKAYHSEKMSGMGPIEPAKKMGRQSEIRGRLIDQTERAGQPAANTS